LWGIVVANELILLAKLGGMVVVAVGAVLLLLRSNTDTAARDIDQVLGYPPNQFMARELVRSEPLVELAAIQARLVSIYWQLPPHSDSAIWLRAILAELRAIMDTAYYVMTITEVYGQPPQLERLIVEVQLIEQEVAAYMTSQLLMRDGDAQHELLDGRLATLRLCARQLANSGIIRTSGTIG
jgi:hypothetical protein